jgi:hypothetical protein
MDVTRMPREVTLIADGAHDGRQSPASSWSAAASFT